MRWNRRKQRKQRGALRDLDKREWDTIRLVANLAGKICIPTHGNGSVSSVLSCSIASLRLSAAGHKYDDVCGEAFLAQARRERRAYPSWVCEERATKPAPKRTAARRVALLLAWGVVARRLQPHLGAAPSSRLAPGQKQHNKRHRIYAHQHLEQVCHPHQHFVIAIGPATKGIVQTVSLQQRHGGQ
jgi:hypothetical protein